MFKCLQKNKKLLSGLALVVFAIEGNCAMSNSLGLNSKYIGVDAGIQRGGFNKYETSQSNFKKSLPKANFFAGIKFNDYLGVEAGYEFSLNRGRNATFNVSNQEDFMGIGGSALGLTGTQTSDVANKYKISGFHFGVTGEYPISASHNPLSFIGYVGIKNTTLKTLSKIIDHPVSGSIGDIYKLKSTKNILRLSLGLQYMLRENIGIRLSSTWENTSKFSPEKSYQFSPAAELASEKLKNSMSYSLGVVFKF